MPAPFARQLLLVAVAVWPTSAAFGQLAPVTPRDSAPQPADVSATDVLIRAPEPPPECGDTRVDLLVGLPLAVRLQQRIGHTRLWAETGVGLYAIIFPEAFVGLRVECPVYEGKRNAILFRPGVDGHIAVNLLANDGGFLGGGPPIIPGVSADVDMLWRRRLGETSYGEMGLKLGAMAAKGDEWAVLPVVGVFCGFQY